jgi:hypothetical protein
MCSFVLIAGNHFGRSSNSKGDKGSTEDLLQPSIKRLVDSSHVCMRKGVLDSGRRLKVVSEGS